MFHNFIKLHILSAKLQINNYFLLNNIYCFFCLFLYVKFYYKDLFIHLKTAEATPGRKKGVVGRNNG